MLDTTPGHRDALLRHFIGDEDIVKTISTLDDLTSIRDNEWSTSHVVTALYINRILNGV